MPFGHFLFEIKLFFGIIKMVKVMDFLSRLAAIVGEDNIFKLKNSKVLVLGLGGVGSYAVEGLVRSGIGSIVLVDYDKVDITNLNRQLMTNINNIGENKVNVMAKRLKKINPNCEVIKLIEKITPENISKLFLTLPDFIIDACDDVSVKKALIKECLKKDVAFISAMGMGFRLDPSKIKISDVRKTSNDPLAKAIRKMVKEENLKGKIPVVYSDENRIKKEGKSIGSAIFVPATCGLYCANFVVKEIIKDESKAN